MHKIRHLPANSSVFIHAAKVRSPLRQDSKPILLDVAASPSHSHRQPSDIGRFIRISCESQVSGRVAVADVGLNLKIAVDQSSQLVHAVHCYCRRIPGALLKWATVSTFYLLFIRLSVTITNKFLLLIVYSICFL